MSDRFPKGSPRSTTTGTRSLPGQVRSPGGGGSTQKVMTISLDVNGKNIVNTTATVEAADYLVYGHALPDNAGHLLALTCK